MKCAECVYWLAMSSYYGKCEKIGDGIEPIISDNFEKVGIEIGFDVCEYIETSCDFGCIYFKSMEG